MTARQVPAGAGELLGVPLPELVAAAGRRRDMAHGTRITYSPKVFIPLTMLCRDRCGYCTFAQPPARLAAPYLLTDEILEIARRGASAGCHEALFTLGERPEERYPVAAGGLGRHGYVSTVDYLGDVSRLVLVETGLRLPSIAGAL
ncbi:MAG TPA: 7,8-didemethyl-8-hydroxy-5-deazariboflavin synthase, partial [Acidimicrobiales bacterium]|nr:7,8-didemethyl-8-hydroxy-5-deazariboflavin synthase [Acidimicrobiales bacterium]